jgi:hypothetical protein
LHAYKLQLFHNITEEDNELCFDFATCVLDWLSEDADYLKAVLCADEATFHTSGVVNRHNYHK